MAKNNTNNISYLEDELFKRGISYKIHFGQEVKLHLNPENNLKKDSGCFTLPRIDAAKSKGEGEFRQTKTLKAYGRSWGKAIEKCLNNESYDTKEISEKASKYFNKFIAKTMLLHKYSSKFDSDIIEDLDFDDKKDVKKYLKDFKRYESENFKIRVKDIFSLINDKDFINKVGKAYDFDYEKTKPAKHEKHMYETDDEEINENYKFCLGQLSLDALDAIDLLDELDNDDLAGEAKEISGMIRSKHEESHKSFVTGDEEAFLLSEYHEALVTLSARKFFIDNLDLKAPENKEYKEFIEEFDKDYMEFNKAAEALNDKLDEEKEERDY